MRRAKTVISAGDLPMYSGRLGGGWVKIFLRWSGERSKAVALALRDWLPIILHYAEPWMSHADIAAGERWSAEIGKEIEATHFGVICLTKENLTATLVGSAS